MFSCLFSEVMIHHRADVQDQGQGQGQGQGHD